MEFVESKEDIVKHVPQLANAKGISQWKGFWNPQAGWAHARKALEKVGNEVNQPIYPLLASRTNLSQRP